MKPPPSTPTPRRFILSKRTPALETPGPNPSQQFQSTPRFGYSAQRRLHDGIDEVEDAHPDDVESTESRSQEAILRFSDAIEAESEGSYPPDVIQAESEASHTPLKTERSPSQVRDQDASPSEDDGGSTPSRARGVIHLSPVLERESKRRRVSSSPSPEHSAWGENDEQVGDEHPDSTTPKRQQPVFQQAPRFKLPEIDQEPDILPEAFSPHRHSKGGKSRRYLPGGMASQVQGWLSEVKGWEESVRPDADTAHRVVVKELRAGSQMYLVRGVESDSDEGRHYMLAGEGKLTGLQGRAAIHEGSVVLLESPVWEINLHDITWTVGCNWSVED